MGLNKTMNNKTFATIVGGKIRVKVEEGTEEAVKREYETPRGDKGVKYELIYDNLDGVISNIRLDQKDWGKMLNVTIDGVTLSLNVASRYAQDLMKRFPALNLHKELQLVPYDFTDKEGKQRSGLTVYQGEKINSYYQNGKEYTNGMPEPDKGDDTNWKIYFLQVEEFLIGETEKLIEKFQNDLPETEQEINIDDIPL